MKKLLLFVIPAMVLILFSCKKDDKTETQEPEALNSAATSGTIVTTQMRSFILSSITVAADSGFSLDFPNDTKKSVLGTTDYSWTGPDADGWYTRSMDGAYNYYEKLRIGDTIDYIMVISYSGADGSFENKTTTKYIKKEKDGKTLYDGYSIWEMHNSGYNNISRWEWRINFTDWNPETSAGIYDWYWGLSENNGGETVPYHRCEHLVATETTPDGWLHCRVIFYDDGGTETWDFEYDTPWSPVSMPVIPGWN